MDNNKFKEGDILISIEGSPCDTRRQGDILVVNGVANGYIRYSNINNGVLDGHTSKFSQLRHATPEEIAWYRSDSIKNTNIFSYKEIKKQSSYEVY